MWWPEGEGLQQLVEVQVGMCGMWRWQWPKIWELRICPSQSPRSRGNVIKMMAKSRDKSLSSRWDFKLCLANSAMLMYYLICLSLFIQHSPYILHLSSFFLHPKRQLSSTFSLPWLSRIQPGEQEKLWAFYSYTTVLPTPRQKLNTC